MKLKVVSPLLAADCAEQLEKQDGWVMVVKCSPKEKPFITSTGFKLFFPTQQHTCQGTISGYWQFCSETCEARVVANDKCKFGKIKIHISSNG